MRLLSAKYRAQIFMSLQCRCRKAHLISDSLAVEATRGRCAVVHGQTDAATAVCGSRESLTGARELMSLGSGTPLI